MSERNEKEKERDREEVGKEKGRGRGKMLPRGRPRGMQNRAANLSAIKGEGERTVSAFLGLAGPFTHRARPAAPFVGVDAKSKIRRSLINYVTPRGSNGRRPKEVQRRR